MKILLINPPNYFPGEVDRLTQNLGLGYLASTLLKDGHRVAILDAAAEGIDRSVKISKYDRVFYRVGLSYDDIVDRIPEDTDAIGMTALYSNSAAIVDELAAAIRMRFPKIMIVIGGVYASVQPERALQSGVDYAVVGEGELPLSALFAGKNPELIPGVWFKQGGEIHNGGRAEIFSDLDSIPLPARDLLPMETYFRIYGRENQSDRIATIVTSRGCPFSCSFCSVHPTFTRKWRPRSPENVLLEIDELINKWKMTHLEFWDDNLTLDPKRAADIFKGLVGKNISWSCPNAFRMDTLDRDLLELMRRSGLSVLHMAIESGDPEMLKIIDKKLDLKKVEEIAGMCHELQIPTIGFFIVGHPGESEKRFKNTLKLAKKLKKAGMFKCGTHIATPYPGTKLLSICRDNKYLIHEDAETRVMFPGDIHITTPDFSKEDVMLRVYKMEVEINGAPNYSYGLRGIFDWKIRPALSKIGLRRREFITDYSDENCEGFRPAKSALKRVRYRRGQNISSLKLKAPRHAETLELFIGRIGAKKINIFLDHDFIGKINMERFWDNYNVPLPINVPEGEASLRFEIDLEGEWMDDYTDEYNFGFNVGWIEFKTVSLLERIRMRYRKSLDLENIAGWRLNGFYEIEKQSGGASSRWTSQEAVAIIDLPRKIKKIKICALSNRNHKAEVFLDENKIGGMELCDSAQEYLFPISTDKAGMRARLKFVSDGVYVPSDHGDSGDSRELGFIVRKIEFE